MDQSLIGIGGVNLVELTKSNLQFVYGKKASLEILSQLKAHDGWQVSVIKTENGTRSAVFSEFSDSGAGLVGALQKLHLKSAGMLSKFITERLAPEDDVSVNSKRNKPEAETATTAAASAASADALPAKAEREKVANAAKKPAVFGSFKPVDISALMNMESDFESCPSNPYDYINHLTRKKLAAAAYWKNPDYELLKDVDRYAQNTECCPIFSPIYDPAEFRRANQTCYGGFHDDVMRLATGQNPKLYATAAAKQAKDKQPAVPQDEPIDVVAVSSQEQLAKGMRAPKQRNNPALYSVILHIQWNGYGEAVVADECQLSVKALQSRVRYLLRTHGRELFGDDASKIPAAACAPEEATNFNSMIKGMRVNDAMLILGPSFGDDLTSMVGSVKPKGPIKIVIELLWNGVKLPINASKPDVAAPASAPASASADAAATTTADAAN